MRADLARPFSFYMQLEELVSAIYNDLISGTMIPASNRQFISLDQIEDECIETRATIIREWYLKSLLTKGELAVALNCVEVDCKDQNKCVCKGIPNAKLAKHFEIPALAEGLGDEAITFIGSTDRDEYYKVYFTKEATRYHQYKKRAFNKPYVYIERTLNENGKYDGWIFNAPYVKNIAIIATFKDPRQLKEYNCCTDVDYLDMGSISDEIKRRILNKKLQLYRTPLYQAPQNI